MCHNLVKKLVSPGNHFVKKQVNLVPIVLRKPDAHHRHFVSPHSAYYPKLKDTFGHKRLFIPDAF